VVDPSDRTDVFIQFGVPGPISDANESSDISLIFDSSNVL
jgi:hypothetical protein